jgi:hypothetical protein
MDARGAAGRRRDEILEKRVSAPSPFPATFILQGKGVLLTGISNNFLERERERDERKSNCNAEIGIYNGSC